VEFDNKEVAKVAAESMNGYLMYGRQLHCHIMDEEKVHPEMFKNANRKFKFIPQKQMFVAKKNKAKTPEQKCLKVKFLLEREEARRGRLKELGYNYEFPGYKKLIESAKEVYGSK